MSHAMTDLLPQEGYSGVTLSHLSACALDRLSPLHKQPHWLVVCEECGCLCVTGTGLIMRDGHLLRRYEQSLAHSHASIAAYIAQSAADIQIRAPGPAPDINAWAAL